MRQRRASKTQAVININVSGKPFPDKEERLSKNSDKMISHKPLKSVSHNFGHSFISLMNYINDDYLLGHILKQSRKTNITKLTVDILNNKAEPKELLTNAIKTSIDHYSKWFPTLVNESGSTMDYVKSATMIIEFDVARTRLFSIDKQIIENPFSCDIIIVDDRGKEYRHRHEGWWYPEP